MKFTDYIKKEFLDLTKFEIFILILAFILIFFNAFIMRDSLPVIISAICGILYTMFAGKGKFYCYLIGLCGSACYSYISFRNGLYGNFLLYLCYYIPLQIIGFFSWKKHLKEASCDVVKVQLANRERITVLFTLIFGVLILYYILNHYNGSNPVFDSITTFASIVAMILTVKRCIEQWVLWFVVNALSFIMWLKVVLAGTTAYSTLVMWGVYTLLAIYFFIMWHKELSQKNNESGL